MTNSSGTVTALCTSGQLNKARFSNGTVYCISNFGSDFIIGYYEISPDGTSCTVQCEYDKGEIGRITPDNDSNSKFSIWLSRLGLERRYIHEGRRVPESPYPSIDEVANAYSFGSIEDSKTHETIAEFTGNCIEAAAAFVVLVYEVFSDTRYHDFYKL